MRTCRVCGTETDSTRRHCLVCFESLPPIKESMKSCLLCGADAENDAPSCAKCGEGSWSVCVDENADTEPGAINGEVGGTYEPKTHLSLGDDGLKLELDEDAEPPEETTRYQPPPPRRVVVKPAKKRYR